MTLIRVKKLLAIDDHFDVTSYLTSIWQQRTK